MIVFSIIVITTQIRLGVECFTLTCLYTFAFTKYLDGKHFSMRISLANKHNRELKLYQATNCYFTINRTFFHV